MKRGEVFERLSVIAVTVLIAAAVLLPAAVWLWELFLG